MSLKNINEHPSIEGYTLEVYKNFGVNSPEDLDESRRPILQLIDHGGSIIDLGCGCGLFLRYLVNQALYPLEPYGVDISVEAIREAQHIVFPTYEMSRFVVADIEDYELSMMFDYIIVNLLYVGLPFGKKFSQYWERLNPNGKIILMITNDTLVRMKSWFALWDYLKARNLKWIQTNPLTIGYSVKNVVLEHKDLRTPIKVKDLLNI